MSRNIRNNPNKVSQYTQNVRHSTFDDAFLLYNGAPEIYEDLADYVRLRGGRIR